MSTKVPCRLLHLDAFASKIFGGNPAAVVLIPRGSELPDHVMASVAAELNLSETSFVSASGPAGSGAYSLRWFTPTVEVALCGHGTLAAARALRLEGEDAEVLHFFTRSGLLCVIGGGDAMNSGALSMAFPFNPAVPRSDAVCTAIWRALAGGGGGLLAGAVDSMHYNSTTRKLVVRLHDATPVETLAAWVPDPGAALSVDQSGVPDSRRVTGVSVTLRARTGGGVSFYSRYFSPWNGILEDPVNGSSHTILGPLWADALAVWGPASPADASTVHGVPGGMPRLGDGDRRQLLHSEARLSGVQLSARGGDLDLRIIRAGLRGHAPSEASGCSSREDWLGVELMPQFSRVVLSGTVALVYSGDVVLEGAVTR